MNYRMLALFLVSPLVLAACSSPQPAPAPAPEPEQKAPTPQVIDFPEAEEDDSDMQGHMMMETAALKESCAVLSSWTPAQRAELLDEIGHNMDNDALDHLLGKKCAVAGQVQKIADVTDDDLKLMPSDSEVLYYSPETQRYFLTCNSANTVAYVVPKADESLSPQAYFQQNRDQFVAAATMAKKMMEEMMDSTGSPQVGDDMHMMEDDAAHGEDMMDDKQAMDDGAVAKRGVYTAYADGVIGNGEESVLFFHASWCPACAKNNKRLTDLYGSGEFPRSVYKIDYDTSDELKQRYGVTQQDTFVLIDGAGEAVEKTSFPSEGALQGLISG